MNTSLSPEVADTILDCLSKHNFPLPHGSGHKQEEHEEEDEAGSLLPNSNNFKLSLASKIRYLLEGASTHSLSPPAKEAIRSLFSSEAEARPLAISIKKSSKEGSKADDSGSSTAVIGVACVVLVALVGIFFYACRGSDEPASPYDLVRDDKPLLGLGDLTGGVSSVLFCFRLICCMPFTCIYSFACIRFFP